MFSLVWVIYCFNFVGWIKGEIQFSSDNVLTPWDTYNPGLYTVYSTRKVYGELGLASSVTNFIIKYLSLIFSVLCLCLKEHLCPSRACISHPDLPCPTVHPGGLFNPASMFYFRMEIWSLAWFQLDQMKYMLLTNDSWPTETKRKS